MATKKLPTDVDQVLPEWKRATGKRGRLTTDESHAQKANAEARAAIQGLLDRVAELEVEKQTIQEDLRVCRSAAEQHDKELADLEQVHQHVLAQLQEGVERNLADAMVCYNTALVMQRTCDEEALHCGTAWDDEVRLVMYFTVADALVEVHPAQHQVTVTSQKREMKLPPIELTEEGTLTIGELAKLEQYIGLARMPVEMIAQFLPAAMVEEIFLGDDKSPFAVLANQTPATQAFLDALAGELKKAGYTPVAFQLTQDAAPNEKEK